MFDFGDLKLLKIECVNSKVSCWTQGLCTFVFLSEQIPSLRSCIVRVLYLQNRKSITPFCHELFLTFFKETKRGGWREGGNSGSPLAGFVHAACSQNRYIQ